MNDNELIEKLTKRIDAQKLINNEFLQKKSISEYIPGFRSDTTWKKILASLYYLTVLLIGFSKGFALSLFYISSVFLVFQFVNLIKNREYILGRNYNYEHKKHANKIFIPFMAYLLMAISSIIISGLQSPAPTQIKNTALQTIQEPTQSIPLSAGYVVEATETPKLTIIATSTPTIAPTPEPNLSPTPKPTLTPTPEPTQIQEQAKIETPKKEKKERIVYITRTGEKYHRDGCRYLSRSQIPISIDNAVDQGYDACSVCGG